MQHVVCPQCDAVNRIPPERDPLAGKCGRCGARLFTGQPLDLDGRRFQAHLSGSTVPLLVDFWASWCGPCRMMAPQFTAAAAELEPRLRLIKINTEQEQELAARYGIRSIPTLALFRGGQEVTRIAGAMDRARLVAWVRSALG